MQPSPIGPGKLLAIEFQVSVGTVSTEHCGLQSQAPVIRDPSTYQWGE